MYLILTPKLEINKGLQIRAAYLVQDPYDQCNGQGLYRKWHFLKEIFIRFIPAIWLPMSQEANDDCKSHNSVFSKPMCKKIGIEGCGDAQNDLPGVFKSSRSEKDPGKTDKMEGDDYTKELHQLGMDNLKGEPGFVKNQSKAV